jgi:hypothetical protein
VKRRVSKEGVRAQLAGEAMRRNRHAHYPIYP